MVLPHVAWAVDKGREEPEKRRCIKLAIPSQDLGLNGRAEPNLEARVLHFDVPLDRAEL